MAFLQEGGKCLLDISAERCLLTQKMREKQDATSCFGGIPNLNGEIEKHLNWIGIHGSVPLIALGGALGGAGGVDGESEIAAIG